MKIRRKAVWLLILMVWVGLVTSIIVYQGSDYMSLETVDSTDIQIADSSDRVEIIDGGVVTNSNPDDVNFTKAKDENNQADFFVEYKLERDKARSEQINIYRELINNPNSDPATKKEAQKMMLALSDKMEKEMEIESLIRARGYKDALAYIHDEAVDVIIHTNGLEKDDVAKVGDIIIKVTGFNTEDVTIIEKKIEK